MTQDKIVKILGNKKLTRKQIQELTDLTQQVVSRCLKQLVKYNELEKEYSESRKKFVYKKNKKKTRKRKIFRPSP